MWEELPPPERSKTEDASTSLPSLVLLPDLPTSAASYDSREITLQLDLSTLRVQHITAVALSADEYVVRRHRSEKGEPLATISFPVGSRQQFHAFRFAQIDGIRALPRHDRYPAEDCSVRFVPPHPPKYVTVFPKSGT